MESLVTDSTGGVWDLSSTDVVAVRPATATVSILVLSSGASVEIHSPFATVSAAFQATRTTPPAP